MFSKLTAVALAGLLTIVAAVPTGGSTLPGTLIISVIDASGAVLGTLNGYGNFSSPGPSYPFRAFATTDGYADLRAYSLVPCTATGVLACGGYVAGTAGSFYVSRVENGNEWELMRDQSLGGNVVLDGTDGLWSVDATTDAAGGLDAFGRSYGIPVHVGASAAAIPVTLMVKSASG